MNDEQWPSQPRGVTVVDGDVCIITSDGEAQRLLVILEEYRERNRANVTRPLAHRADVATYACADDLITQMRDAGVRFDDEESEEEETNEQE